MRILIADSGSTKTEWALCTDGTEPKILSTQGINPFFIDSQGIQTMLATELLPGMGEFSPDAVYYYGAGCSTEPKKDVVKDALSQLWPDAKVEVEHDMLAAARSLCGRDEGIAVIAGTGSNSCLFNGEKITGTVISISYLMADEGSGNNMGKLFLLEYLYQELPEDLDKAFYEFIKMEREEIIDRLYKGSYPNRFLASIAPFLHKHREHPLIKQIIRSSINSLFERQIKKLKGYEKLPIHFTGSIAFYFEDEFREVIRERGLKAGRFLKSPLQGLIEFHCG